MRYSVQSSEVCSDVTITVSTVSRCVAGIEGASVKLRAVLLYLWILNSVSAISCGDVIVRSMQTLIN